MDIFSEQLVRKERGGLYIAEKIGILAGAFILAMALIMVILVFVPLVAMFGFLGGFGILYLGLYLSNCLDVEYEYIVTGTCLDIDKIINMKRRKRLISVDIPTFEMFGKYTENTELPDCDATVEAIYSKRAPLYYAVFDDEHLGKVLLLFNPDDRTLDTIDTSLPRNLRVF